MGKNLTPQSWNFFKQVLLSHYTFLNFQAFSTRSLTAIWWLFCTILLVLYIVSLGTSILNQINRKQDLDLNWFIQNEQSRLVALKHGATASLLKVGGPYFWRFFERNGKGVSPPESLKTTIKTIFLNPGREEGQMHPSLRGRSWTMTCWSLF